MQQFINMQNLTSLYDKDNASDVDSLLSFDDTIEGAAADNYSDLCPSFSYPNITYLNVSCDAALDFSVPLYGECLLR